MTDPVKGGAPKGSRNKAKGIEWTDQLKWQLANYSNSTIQKGLALRAIAQKVVEQALDGDWKAIEEIGNRLEGKPVQSVDLRQTVVERVEELSDAELTDIAAGRGLRVAETEGSETIN
jgi:hypothetical protein